MAPTSVGAIFVRGRYFEVARHASSSRWQTTHRGHPPRPYR